MNIIKKICKLKSIWNWPILKNNIKFLMQNDIVKYETERRYIIKDETIEECAYEIDEYKEKLVHLDVLNSNQTIQMLKNYPKSFSRFGDGEVYIMQGKDQAFQKYEPLLANKMLDILSKKRENMYVGLNHAYFQSPNNFAERNKKFYRLHATELRRFFIKHCDKTNIYLDASCFGAYYRFGDEYDYENHYSNIKALFKNKKIAILTGEGVLDKLEFDIFEKALDKKMIYGPRINAFSEYDSLIAKVEKEIPKDYLICIILGQTATVLVADLTDKGYIAWDVGHVAKDYDAYMKKTEKTQENMDAFWAPD